MAHSGDGSGWDITDPANSEDAGDGAQEIRDLRAGVGIRMGQEHVALGTSPTYGGEHKEGSAKAYYEAAEPSNRPNGSTSLASTADDGRLWVDSDDDSLWVYYGDQFNLVQMVAGNFAADSIETAAILDSNVTFAKLEDFNGQGYILRGGAAGVPEEHDASGDAKILIGDGTDIVSVAVTGVIAIDNTGLTSFAGSGGPMEYIKLVDSKSDGTEGGAFDKDAWQKRTVTEESDTGENVSVSSSVITMEAGTYRCRIRCPAYKVNSHVARLYQTSGTPAVLVLGSAMYTGSSMTVVSDSWIIGKFTLASQQTLEIQHYCTNTQPGDGFGKEANIGVAEVYTVAEFWKEP